MLTVGLAMTGGGARGAYQAGVLKRIGEIKRVEALGNPFPVLQPRQTQNRPWIRTTPQPDHSLGRPSANHLLVEPPSG